MTDRIIVLKSGVDKREIADTTCCPTGVTKVKGD